MHELAITEGIINVIRSQAEEKGFQKVLLIELSLGEYSDVIPGFVEQCFPIAAKGSVAEGAQLRFTRSRAVFRCRACGYEGAVERKAACCPQCQSDALTMLSGREFYVDKITVE